MAEHAKFSFSAAHRWMECPGSIEACAGLPGTSSWQADLGTKLHGIAAAVLEGTATNLMDDLSNEHAGIVTSYVDYVRDLSSAPLSKLLVEQRVALSRDMWGTCDAIVIQPYVLHIVDFKTGSQRVDAVGNAQLLGYAAAALNEFNVMPSPVCHSVPPVDVCMHIVQSSLDWVDTWTVPVATVHEFVKKMNAAAAKACAPSPSYFPSAKACQWCPARESCRPRAEFNVRMAVEDFALAAPATLSAAELADILPQVPQILSWATSVQSYATSLAIKGERLKGYKLVQTGGARKWRDGAQAIQALIGAGVPILAAQKVSPIGIGDAEQLLGKKHAVFTDQTVRGEIKPSLVPNSDRRKEWDGSGDFPDGLE